MSYRKGSKVWVEEKGEGWLEAEVVDAKERAVVVLTSQRKKVPCLKSLLLISLPHVAVASHSVRLKFALCRLDFFRGCECGYGWQQGSSGGTWFARVRFEFISIFSLLRSLTSFNFF